MKPMLYWAVILLATMQAAAAPAPTADTRSRVLEAVATHLEQDYVDPQVGRRAADQLREDMREERFNAATNAEQFAAQVSARLQELTDDGHLNIEYSEQPVSDDRSSQQDYSDAQMQRWYGAHINYGVNSVQRLPGNLGYLDLRVFPPTDMGGETIAAAMTVLADLDGLVIDLRSNGGGVGDTADLVASYLFDGGRQPLTGLYDRPSDTLSQRFTLPYVPGKRFGSTKPVYVLISAKTFSAAEALAYNLQALERATIVGETSGGGAHPFDYLPIDEHFVLWSVTARSVNPITGGNWQYVGVKPDVEAPADEALRVAQDLYAGSRENGPEGP